MLTKDKNAVVDYLEFNLVGFLQKYEQHLDSEVVGPFYADAHALLVDMEDTMQLAVDSEAADKTSKS